MSIFGAGHEVVTSSTKPASPSVGQMIYCTDTDEYLKYVSYGGANRWMQAVLKPNRNVIINGGFAVDQRNAGAAQTITAAAALAYTRDRWYAYCTGANVTVQRTAGSAPYQYYYSVTGLASNTAVGIGTRLEAANTYQLANTTATLSGWFASTSLTSITWTAYYANTADSFGSVASPTRTSIATGTFTISSTLSYQSVAISIPAAATTGIEIVFTTGALLGSQTLTITGVQLEQGSVPSTFEFRDAGEELRRCQRYYYQMGPYASGGYGSFGTGFAINTTTIQVNIPYPVTMRSAPATLTTAAAAQYGNFVANTITACNIAPNIAGVEKDVARIQGFVASGMTAGGGAMLVANLSTTAFLGFSAEL